MGSNPIVDARGFSILVLHLPCTHVNRVRFPDAPPFQVRLMAGLLILAQTIEVRILALDPYISGASSMAELQSSKLMTGVRFPCSAPYAGLVKWYNEALVTLCPQFDSGLRHHVTRSIKVMLSPVKGAKRGQYPPCTPFTAGLHNGSASVLHAE